MRPHLKLLILSLVLIFAGCDKEAAVDADIQGSWELRHVKGVQIADAPSDYPAGNGNIVEFKGNTYQIYNKDKLLLSTAFRIERDGQEIDGTDFLYKIIYQEYGHESFRYIKVSGGTLIISSGTTAADGSTATYQKVT